MKERVSFPPERWVAPVLTILVLPAALLLAYRWNPAFSHDLTETFSVIVACGIFMLTWNARKFVDNHYFIFLGIAYLFVGVIDYLHALSFGGAFTRVAHSNSIELWFAARFVQSFALLFAPFFVSRKTRPWLVLSGFAVVSTALVALALAGAFPDYSLPGGGLTGAKRLSDHLVAGIQLLSIGTLWRVRRHFDRDVFHRLVLSILFSIAAVLSADLYTDAYVYNSVIGHYLTVVSFYLLYKAIVATGLIRPYDLLFRNLKRSEEQVRSARDELEVRVAERTAELRMVNQRLEGELAERRRAGEMREMLVGLLGLINSARTVEGLAGALNDFFKDRYDCEAAAIRYRRGSDYPYLEPRGFGEDFVRAEMSLCPAGTGRGGGDSGDRCGSLDCVCGEVIARRHDLPREFFTPNGTFWTNGASGLFASSGVLRTMATRGRCFREGYESMALVPLRIGEETIGLLQMNDRRAGRFTPEIIAQLERAADNVAVAIARRLMEEALRKSEDRFRSLVENAPVGTMIVREGVVVFRNPELQHLLGPVREGDGFDRLGVLHPEDVAKFDRFREAVRAGEAFLQGIELRFSVPSSASERTGHRWVHCRSVPIEFGGQPAALVNMVDITRVKDLEQIVTVREKLASLGQLAAGIAHEIRNPLSGININVSTLDLLCHRAEGLSLEEKEKVRAVIDQAKAASGKISAVVKRIMDFSKPMPPRMDRIDVVRVVRETLALSAASISKSRVELLKELPSEPLYCRADVTLLEQVILNLVTNALQAMETVDREKRLTVGVAREEQQAVIRVVDSGPGVPGNLLGKIFDPFYTTRKDGHGIGLSFSHRVIAEHNGRLSAGAAEGGGAVFRVELPLWRERKPA